MKIIRQNQTLAVVTECRSESGIATRDFLNRLADKWSILIVIVLAHRPKNRARFSDLKNGIEGISQTMLTSTLRSLERDGLLLREVFPEVPPRVEYELTKLGLSVLEPMQALASWASRNWSTVKHARERFDSRDKSNHHQQK